MFEPFGQSFEFEPRSERPSKLPRGVLAGTIVLFWLLIVCIVFARIMLSSAGLFSFSS